MSVVADRDLRRLPRRQAVGVVGSASLQPVRPHRAAPRHPPSRPVRAGQRVGSRERLLRDGRRYPAGCSARSPLGGWAATVLLAVLLAGGIVGLGVLAQGMAGLVSETAPVPEDTALVVIERGQNLWELARHYAPDSAAAAVVDRIERLNELTGSGVHAGTPLVVPVQPEAAP